MPDDEAKKSDTETNREEPKAEAAESGAPKPDSQKTQIDSSAERSKTKKPATKAPAKSKVDLAKLQKTTTTQAPRVLNARDESPASPKTEGSAKARPISETRREKVKAKDGPEMDWKIAIIAVIAIMMLGFVAHIFGINGGLVLNDRFNLSYLFSQGLLADSSMNVMRDLISHPLQQPWAKASFIGDYGEYKNEFMWYHTVNVFWHALTSGLVFTYILTVARHLHFRNRLGVNPYYLAIAAAALFACHPLSSETVTYLSCRSVLLGCNNYFLSLNFVLLGCLVKHKIARACFLLMALWTGAMSIWCNPEMVTLPVVAALTVIMIRNPLSKLSAAFSRNPIILSGCAVLAILLPMTAMLGYKCTDAINYYTAPLSSISYAASQFKAFTFYFLRCFPLPIALSIDPPMAIANAFTDPFAIAGIAVLAGLIYALTRFKNEPIFFIASALVLAGFVPHAIILQRDVVADWVSYLPLTGVMIFMAWALVWFGQKNFRNAVLSFTAILLAFTGLSVSKDLEWCSNFSLWQNALSLRPKSGLAHAMLAIQYLNRLQFDLAEKHAKLAVEFAPDQVMARIAQAKIALSHKNSQQALEIFEGAERLAKQQNLPRAISYECELGQIECYIAKNDLKTANILLMKLNKEKQGDPRLLYLVANAALDRREYEAAFRTFQDALTQDPSLTQALEPMTRAALALRLYEQAYTTALNFSKHYDSPEVKLLLARTLIVNKREPEAEQILKELITADGRNARAMYLLSRLYKRTGKVQDWNKYRQDAVKIDANVAADYALPELDIEDSISIPDKK